jgi:hypothetical protein
MRLHRIGVVGATLLALSVPAGGTAVAASAPSVSFQFAHNRITAGHQPRIVYSSTGLPNAATIVLQRWSRSAGEWRRAASLPALSGRAPAPAADMGRARYRLVAKQAGHRVAASHSRRLWAYGPVPLATLCASPEVTIGAGSECRAGLGVAQVGTRLFAYQAALGSSSASVAEAITVARSTCRNLRLEIAVDPAQDPSGTTTVGVSLQQEGNDAVVIFLARSTSVSAMDPNLLVARAWNISTNVLYPVTSSTRVLVAGTASCWSATGA